MLGRQGRPDLPAGDNADLLLVCEQYGQRVAKVVVEEAVRDVSGLPSVFHPIGVDAVDQVHPFLVLLGEARAAAHAEDVGLIESIQNERLYLQRLLGGKGETGLLAQLAAGDAHRSLVVLARCQQPALALSEANDGGWGLLAYEAADQAKSMPSRDLEGVALP